MSAKYNNFYDRVENKAVEILSTIVPFVSTQMVRQVMKIYLRESENDYNPSHFYTWLRSWVTEQINNGINRG